MLQYSVKTDLNFTLFIFIYFKAAINFRSHIAHIYDTFMVLCEFFEAWKDASSFIATAKRKRTTITFIQNPYVVFLLDRHEGERVNADRMFSFGWTIALMMTVASEIQAVCVSDVTCVRFLRTDVTHDYTKLKAIQLSIIWKITLAKPTE